MSKSESESELCWFAKYYDNGVTDKKKTSTSNKLWHAKHEVIN